MVVEIGKRAPDFELPVAGGDHETARLDVALEKGPVVVSVYKSSCRASKVLFPFLESLSNGYSSDRLTIWGLSLDSQNVTSSFIRRYELTFPNLVDEEGYPTAQSYEVEETPTTYLIGQDGNVLWAGVAFNKAELDELSEKVAALIDETVADITSNSTEVPDTVPG
jgi:peroxiredoxin